MKIISNTVCGEYCVHWTQQRGFTRLYQVPKLQFWDLRCLEGLFSPCLWVHCTFQETMGVGSSLVQKACKPPTSLIQVPAGIFIESDVEHLWLGPDFPHLFPIFWNPKSHKTYISESICAFYLWSMHLHVLHGKLKAISSTA